MRESAGIIRVQTNSRKWLSSIPGLRNTVTGGLTIIFQEEESLNPQGIMVLSAMGWL